MAQLQGVRLSVPQCKVFASSSALRHDLGACAQAANSAVQRLPFDSPGDVVERAVKQAITRSCLAYNGRRPEVGVKNRMDCHRMPWLQCAKARALSSCANARHNMLLKICLRSYMHHCPGPLVGNDGQMHEAHS